MTCSVAITITDADGEHNLYLNGAGNQTLIATFTNTGTSPITCPANNVFAYLGQIQDIINTDAYKVSFTSVTLNGQSQSGWYLDCEDTYLNFVTSSNVTLPAGESLVFKVSYQTYTTVTSTSNQIYGATQSTSCDGNSFYADTSEIQFAVVDTLNLSFSLTDATDGTDIYAASAGTQTLTYTITNNSNIALSLTPTTSTDPSFELTFSEPWLQGLSLTSVSNDGTTTTSDWSLSSTTSNSLVASAELTTSGTSISLAAGASLVFTLGYTTTDTVPAYGETMDVDLQLGSRPTLYGGTSNPSYTEGSAQFSFVAPCNLNFTLTDASGNETIYTTGAGTQTLLFKVNNVGTDDILLTPEISTDASFAVNFTGLLALTSVSLTSTTNNGTASSGWSLSTSTNTDTAVTGFDLTTTGTSVSIAAGTAMVFTLSYTTGSDELFFPGKLGASMQLGARTVSCNSTTPSINPGFAQLTLTKACSLAMSLSDGSDEDYVYVGNTEKQVLKFTVNNNGSETFLLSPTTSAETSFIINFPEDSLLETIDLTSVTNNGTADTGWTITPVVTNDLITSLNFNTTTTGTTLSAGKSLVFSMSYTTPEAAGDLDSSAMDVEMLLGERTNTCDGGGDPDGDATYSTLYVNLQGFQPLPLAVEFMGSDSILNNGTSQALSFQLINTNDNQPLLLTSESSFTIWFDTYGTTDSGTSDAWAFGSESDFYTTSGSSTNTTLATTNSAWTITGPTSQSNIEWTLTTSASNLPAYIHNPTASEIPLQFNFTNLKTSAAPGWTNMYVRYRNLVGYPDGIIVARLQKTSLINNPDQGNGMTLFATDDNTGLAISSGGTGINVSSDGTGVDVTSTDTDGEGINVTSSATGITVTADGTGVDVTSTDTDGEGINVTSSATGITVTADGTGVDVTSTDTDGEGINVTSSATGITVNSSATGINVTSDGTGIDVTSTDADSEAININSDGAGINISSDGAAIDINSKGEGINLSSTDTGIDVTSQGEGINVTTDSGTGINVTTDGGTGINVTASGSNPAAVFSGGTGVQISQGTGANTLSMNGFGWNVLAFGAVPGADPASGENWAVSYSKTNSEYTLTVSLPNLNIPNAVCLVSAESVAQGQIFVANSLLKTQSSTKLVYSIFTYSVTPSPLQFPYPFSFIILG